MRMRNLKFAFFFGLTVGLHSPIGLASENSIEPKVSTIGGVTTATIIVPVTNGRAWDVLTRYESTGIRMPDIKDAKVLVRSGNSLKLSQVYQAPYTFGLEIQAVLVIKETPKNKIEYQLVKGELIRSLKGSWNLTPVHGGTLVSHVIEIDPEVPEIIKPLFYELSETNLSQSMLILRKLMLEPSKPQHLGALALPDR